MSHVPFLSERRSLRCRDSVRRGLDNSVLHRSIGSLDLWSVGGVRVPLCHFARFGANEHSG